MVIVRDDSEVVDEGQSVSVSDGTELVNTVDEERAVVNVELWTCGMECLSLVEVLDHEFTTFELAGQRNHECTKHVFFLLCVCMRELQEKREYSGSWVDVVIKSSREEVKK